MTTYADLRSAVSRDLRDPDNQTFEDPTVKDLVNAALAQIGRIAPQRFQEDLTPVADAMSYPLQDAVFGRTVPEIELIRVELWDSSLTPPDQIARIEPADQAYVNDSTTGWKVWDGTLELPRYVPVFIAGSESNYLIRVWGYCPYPPLYDDEDIVPVSNERENALRVYCQVEAYRRLMSDRSLFTQWQTRSNNSDVSPASLMNGFSLAQDEWRRLSRAITVLRENPG